MDEQDLIPLSALQHYLFCPRQCALIHVDGLWEENRLTVEGALLHRRADTPGHRTRGVPAAGAERIRTERALPLLHRGLGLIGKADCVEFPIGTEGREAGPPRPVEHKRGKPKRIDADRVQLCAQAICLEEMTGRDIPEGELFYNAVRRRERVVFDGALRKTTLDAIDGVRRLIRSNTTPRARYAAKCKNCSLLNLCMPKGTGPSRDPRLYLSRSLEASLTALAEDGPG